MRCAADKKTAAVCSATALTHEVMSHVCICQIEEWYDSHGKQVKNQMMKYNNILR